MPAPAAQQQELNVPQVSDSEKKTVDSTGALKQKEYGPTVKEVEVVYFNGQPSVNKTVILSNMRTTVGQPYSPAAVEEDVKNLYATGLFVNLRITDEPMGDGVKVVIVVQPKPLIKDVVFIGNSKVKQSRLRKEAKTKVGEPLSEHQVAEDQQKIREYYLSKGFNNIQVTYKIDVNEEANRAVVTFTVNEGDKSFIREVDFKGNTAFTEKELRKIFKKTKKKNWLSFINKSGLYKDDEFKEDLDKLKEFYQNHGYIDFEVKDTQVTYPESGDIHIAITIFEGIQYKVGKLELDGETVYDEKTVRKALTMSEGGVFSPKGLDDNEKAIRDLYGKKGYIDTEIKVERTANVESAQIDLNYHLAEGAQTYVDKIVIQGNTTTKDKVIRREIAVAPGEVYDSVRVDASKKRLENIGYFEKVDITPEDTSVPNRRNMVINVSEKKTGSVTFGIGFSSVDSLLGFVELQQGNFDIANFPNFTGGGQKFRSRVQYGLTRKDLTMSVVEPWFLDKPLSLGFDIFAHQLTNNYQTNLWGTDNYGASVYLAKQLTPFWTASIKYQLQQTSLYDFDASVPVYLPGLYQERGTRSESGVTGTLTYDTRDSVFLTRHGEKVSFSAMGAGGPLWGQTNIYSMNVTATKWFLLPYDLIFSVNGGTGVVNRYGGSDRVPIYERLFLGGSRSVRGFDNQQVGPKYDTGEPAGGLTDGYANFELTFPIIDRVRGAVFYDAGFVDAKYGEFTHIGGDYNSAVGIGLRLNLPIGPLRFDYGVPLKHDQWNGGSGKFAFDVGYQF
ncbi:Beta-barrel assembly machine subunit BamA [Verrucomicrobium sp. GAS474]|nr:Beta-barrel assembly machine subunit BamA [Verrucomicrobium sp. GAS474]